MSEGCMVMGANAFEQAWSLVKAPWYYHATPMENLPSIAARGIKPSMGEVYASRDQDGGAKWVGMIKPTSRQILSLPFFREEGDPRMQPGVDHSPILAHMLGIDPEQASFVSREGIPSREIDWENAMQYENPFYIEDLEEKMKEARRILDEEREED